MTNAYITVIRKPSGSTVFTLSEQKIEYFLKALRIYAWYATEMPDGHREVES